VVAAPAAPADAGRRRLLGSTLTTAFRTELNELCASLEARECRHIRCLRPNDAQMPLVFDDASMLRQCRYSGLLEATRIRRFGFGHRRSQSVFLQRYILIFHEARRVTRAAGCEALPLPQDDDSASAACAAICDAMRRGGVAQEEVCMGRTKVFLREAALVWLEDARVLIAAARITSVSRAWHAKRRWGRLRLAIVRLQALARGFLVRAVARQLRKEALEAAARDFEKATLAATSLQRWWRGCIPAHRHPEVSMVLSDQELWKAQRRAAWVSPTARSDTPSIEVSPPALRSPRGASKFSAQRAKLVGHPMVAGVAGRHRAAPLRKEKAEKENQAPRGATATGGLARKAQTSAACSPPPSPRPAASVVRHALAPSPSAVGSGEAGRRRQVLGALSEDGRRPNRLQAQLFRLGKALQHGELPPEQAEVVEEIMDSLMVDRSSASTSSLAGSCAHASLSRASQRGLLQPPWKPTATAPLPSNIYGLGSRSELSLRALGSVRPVLEGARSPRSGNSSDTMGASSVAGVGIRASARSQSPPGMTPPSTGATTSRPPVPWNIEEAPRKGRQAATRPPILGTISGGSASPRGSQGQGHAGSGLSRGSPCSPRAAWRPPALGARPPLCVRQHANSMCNS